MQSIAVSETMDYLTDGHLRAGVLGTDGRPVKRSFRPINMVNHSTRFAKFLHKPIKYSSLLILSGTPDLRQQPYSRRLLGCDIRRATFARRAERSEVRQLVSSAKALVLDVAN